MKTNQLILYTTAIDTVKVEVTFAEDSFWLTQKAMSNLFNVEVPAINKHLSSIFDSNELTKEATVSKMEIVQKEGDRNVRRNVEFYHLKAVLAVG